MVGTASSLTVSDKSNVFSDWQAIINNNANKQILRSRIVTTLFLTIETSDIIAEALKQKESSV